MLTQKISVIYIFLYYFLYGFSYNLSKIDITQVFDKMLSYIQRNKYRTFAMITYNFKEDTDMSEIKQPASALSSPRFCNMGTFMRMQKVLTLRLQVRHLIQEVLSVLVQDLVRTQSVISLQ